MPAPEVEQAADHVALDPPGLHRSDMEALTEYTADMSPEDFEEMHSRLNELLY